MGSLLLLRQVFNSAGITVTALRNGLSVWTVELMVFLYKNRAFMPSVKEVVAEILGRTQAKKVAKKAARAASKGAAAASSPSSSSSPPSPSSSPVSSSSSSSAAGSPQAGADADAGGEVGFEEEDPDTENTVLSESAVESILNDIASFRGAPADCDYGEDDTDSFLAFIEDLERSDRAADLFSLGIS
jgi:hypothetical protein